VLKRLKVIGRLGRALRAFLCVEVIESGALHSDRKTPPKLRLSKSTQKSKAASY
jgi:hypothetical protein